VVTLRADEQWAEIAVADDGVGGANAQAGGGLRGLCDRVEALSGHLTLASVTAGTSVKARVPVQTHGKA
jgi:signal transduction histidine kinase